MNENTLYRHREFEAVNRPPKANRRIPLKLVVGLLGYCAINDGINTYQKLQSAEAAFAPIVARAEDLSRVRYLVSLARDTIAQDRYNSEMWAGLFRLDNKCVCDERLLMR